MDPNLLNIRKDEIEEEEESKNLEIYLDNHIDDAENSKNTKGNNILVI